MSANEPESSLSAAASAIEAELARLKPEESGERIGNYKLLEQIGEGGFGRVWVAEQERPVQRRVALKIIKLGMDTREVIARFEQERQALAMMDHPYIAKVHDAGATPFGRPFFVMELVRGIKITDYCDQGRLSTADRLQLFIAVCQAVQHAHEKGIIHRDLKPSNILVTLHDGVPVPKVIDFGIAKATQQQRLTDLTVYTQLEQMIGTPLYMSPEQAEMSGLEIDARSDIYSLGVLLYELLTGRTPFNPETLMRQAPDEIRRAIREEEPQKPSTFVSTMAADLRTSVARGRQTESRKLVSELRGDLDWIVMKALEKDRTRRYETANALAMDIQRHLANEPVLARAPNQIYRFQRLIRRNKQAIGAAAAILLALAVVPVLQMVLKPKGEMRSANTPAIAQQAGLVPDPRQTIRSIAVLPLRNLSGDPAQDYYADGMTDSLTTDLSRLHSVRVISFQSVQQYKGERTKSLPEIARELNVDAVIEGSLQRSGDQVMINAQLIQAATDQHLWAERYARDTRDLMNTQNEIVLAITEAIKIQLTPQEKTRFTKVRAVNPEAQSHYFLGRFQFGLGTEAGYRQAISEYEAATRSDPHFAPAYAGIADCYISLSSFYVAPREAMPKAEAAARQALELEPDLGEAHSALGYLQFFYHWNPEESERELRSALELSPNYSTAHMNYGLLLLAQARFDDALAELKTAANLEPTSAVISFQTEWALFLAGKYDQTIAQAAHTLALEPKMAGSHSQMGLAYLYAGDKEKALIELKTAYDLEPSSMTVTNYCYGLAVSGQKEEAERFLNRFLEQTRGTYICAYEVACAYEAMKARTEALQWLQRGYDEKCDCMVWESTEPWMADFRKDPRYKAIIAKTGLLRANPATQR